MCSLWKSNRNSISVLQHQSSKIIMRLYWWWQWLSVFCTRKDLLRLPKGWRFQSFSYVHWGPQHNCYYCSSDKKRDSKQLSYFLVLVTIFILFFFIILQAIRVYHLSLYMTDFFFFLLTTFSNKTELEVIFEGIFNICKWYFHRLIAIWLLKCFKEILATSPHFTSS